LLDATITSRTFSTGFDIRTPIGIFTAKKVPLSPTGEVRILDPSGNQAARLETESFFSSVYNIIIRGGGFYQFGCSEDSNQKWTCKGEGKLFCISEKPNRKFDFSEDAQKIAECSKSRFSTDYKVKVFNDADLKLVMCVFIALSLLEHQSTGVPD
jgi:uncharacterized protein YxjI